MSARVVPARLGQLTDPTQFCEPLDIDEMPKEDLLHFVRSMLLIRRVEETIADMVESGEAKCPCHLGIGQEGAAVGVAAALRPTDRAFGAHRSHSHYVAMGGNVRQLLAEVLGKVTGCSRGFGGSMHLRDTSIGLMGTVPIVGATIPLAVGAALALKLSGGDAVAVSFLGDGATEEGVFHESLNLAKNLAVPVLFVVENNLYSSHLHIDLRQSVDRTARFAEAHNVRSEVIDGNDVVRVARTTRALVDEMRRDREPAFIEAVTYRWRGHVGHREDQDVGVERTDNLHAWRQRDPVRRLTEALDARGDIDPSGIEQIDDDVRTEVAEALEFARNSEFPPDDDLLGIVYSPPARR